MSEEWIKIAAQWGIAGFVLLAVGIGIWKGLWPFLRKMIEDAQIARSKEIELFTQHLERRDARQTEMSEKHVAAIEKHTVAITSLTGEFQSFKSEARDKWNSPK